MIHERIFGIAKKLGGNRLTAEDMLFPLFRLPLVASLYDSIYFSKVIKPKSAHLPGIIVIEGYNVCNLRCVHCPYPIMTRQKTQMPLSLYQKIIEDSVEVGIKMVGLHNYSEPLLDSLIFDRVEFAKSKGMYVAFSSNGTLLTTEKKEQIVDSGLDEIYFSFDGASKEVYERIRVGAQFEKVVASINELIAYKKRRKIQKPRILISCVVQKENYLQMRQLPKKLRELFKGVDAIGMQVVDPRRDKSALLPKRRVAGTKMSRVYPCAFVWTYLMVLSSGDVVPCCIDYDGSIILGNLNKQSIEEIWNSEEFKNMRALHLNRRGEMIKLCQDCPHIHERGVLSWLLWEQLIKGS